MSLRNAVILLSQQNLPNLLFLKQLGSFENIICLTTRQMQHARQLEYLLEASKISQNYIIEILVDPEDYQTTLKALRAKSNTFPDNLFVNLTGGTKMMALAAFTFFSKMENNRLFYMPIGSGSILELSPTPTVMPIQAKLTLQEYLSAHGVVIKSHQKDWYRYTDKANALMEGLLKGKNPKMEILTIPEPAERDKKFFSGEWLEIWLAHAINAYWKIPKEQIYCGVILARKEAKSEAGYEYDVLFMKDNMLYIGECKYFSSEKFNITKIRSELFKFATMNRQLGLNARPFIVIANKFKDLKQIQVLQDQCQTLKLPMPADLTVLSKNESFVEFLERV